MKCSRCSGEGRAERDRCHTAPTVTPPHRNLREEKRVGEDGNETKRWRERERERKTSRIN